MDYHLNLIPNLTLGLYSKTNLNDSDGDAYLYTPIVGSTLDDSV